MFSRGYQFIKSAFWPQIIHILKGVGNHKSKCSSLRFAGWNMASIVFTAFFYDLTKWHSFSPQLNHIKTLPWNHQDKPINFHVNWMQNMASRVHTVFEWFDMVTRFSPIWLIIRKEPTNYQYTQAIFQYFRLKMWPLKC